MWGLMHELNDYFCKCEATHCCWWPTWSVDAKSYWSPTCLKATQTSVHTHTQRYRETERERESHLAENDLDKIDLAAGQKIVFSSSWSHQYKNYSDLMVCLGLFFFKNLSHLPRSFIYSKPGTSEPLIPSVLYKCLSQRLPDCKMITPA